jgi:hypothetical protein
MTLSLFGYPRSVRHRSEVVEYRFEWNCGHTEDESEGHLFTPGRVSRRVQHRQWCESLVKKSGS